MRFPGQDAGWESRWPLLPAPAAPAAGVLVTTMRLLTHLLIFGPLIVVVLGGEWVAIGVVAALFLMLGQYGIERLDNGEGAWREYWDDETT